MFQAVPCTVELSEKLKSNPEFSMSVRYETESRLPLTKLALYSYSTEGCTYYYGKREQKITKSEFILCFEGIYNSEEFLEGFRIFSETVRLFWPRREIMFIAEELLTTCIQPILDEVNLKYKEYPTEIYYMSKRQEDLLNHSPELPLPEGYELGSCNLGDAKLITDLWIHNSPGQEDQTRMKVTVFPSTCVRFQGDPVAFEMVGDNGMLNHLFVKEQHRGKGLGQLVEQDLAQKLIRENLIVYKTVETFNKAVLKGSQDSPFWTRKVKADGSPLIKVYLEVWPAESSGQRQ